MIVYSKKIIQFVNEIQGAIKEILAKEICLKVVGDRFYDQSQRASYPIKVVIFNNKSMLGYFDSDFYELGFHERMMHSPREQLHHLIRHELAHYMAYIIHGAFIQPHGVEFRAFCKLMGWSEEVYRASSCLENEQISSGIEESSILRKVQKLMALATSSNEHEAELAMIKSQQLLLKHNIESKYIDGEGEGKVFLKRIIKQKKENAKMRAIAKILETFFVSTVYSRAGGFIYLEILGDSVNIEIAEYVATILQSELDRLWKQAQKQAHLKGTIAKNSFFLGLARGYCNKIHALKREYQNDVANALMVIEKKLTEAKEMVYQRLSSTKSSGSYCQKSSALGEQMGRLLNINPAINRSSTNSGALIGVLI
ncbi:MAG: SprT-like domain-containing protein [Chlamydiales bacterium]